MRKLRTLRRKELALQEIEERYRLAMEAGRMFAFEWNPATDEVRRSADCSSIYGANGNAGKDTLERVHPDDRQALIEAVKTPDPYQRLIQN
jgi:PAS domain-containing protein